MAFGSMQDSGRQAPMAEINVVPLVDVMLVLLIIFIITAPLLTHSVKIDLPKAESVPNITQPEHVELAIRARVMSIAAKAGVARIGFITDPSGN